jgi:hippurate hydrolase
MKGADLVALRRDIHRHPETAFEEHRTAELVAGELRTLGLACETGIAGTGVVATLTRGEGPAIGLRADLDALHLQEENSFAHRSVHEGKMHACGHDGHVAMLLGGARRLVANRRIRGTVHFIFQPAEENECGGRVMIEDGLFERFPMQRVFGMHNWPGLPAGEFAVCEGPIMAAFDQFEIIVKGRSAHAAMPQQGDDTVVAAAQLVLALQTVSSRLADPLDAVVVSVTQIEGGSTWNVLPGSLRLRGGVRHFRSDTQIADQMRRIVEGIGVATGTEMDFRYTPRYPATINSREETEVAADAAASIAGATRVHVGVKPSMASEDFGFMLQQRPGCYIWIGNGDGDSPRLHNARYDFNDDIIDTGARYWERLAECCLARAETV